jgi:predicted DCC family thiol-disulfide oxidoreductase YuxK
MPECGPRTIVFYDGDCGLCQRFVQFLVARDRAGMLQYAPLQGRTAAEEGIAPRLAGGAIPETVVLKDPAGVFQESDAALRAIVALGGLWTMVGWLRAVPRPVRDGVYRFVARHRFQWMGRAESCPLPGAGIRARFLP